MNQREPVKIIEGWLSDEEGQWLYFEARGVPVTGTIVEIGSYYGKATAQLMRGSQNGNGAPVYTIDPHTGGTDAYRRQALYGQKNLWTFPMFRENLQACGLWEYVRPLVMTSAQAVFIWGGWIDLLFIDGDHTYEVVHQDLRDWLPYVRPGGKVAVHDAVCSPWPGVQQAVEDELASYSQFTDIGAIGSICYGTRKREDVNTLP
jgi:predicted O-methyltransferase YrrM